MAAAVIRNMPIGQNNIHVLPNNCLIMSGSTSQNQNGLLHHQQQHHHLHIQHQQHHQHTANTTPVRNASILGKNTSMMSAQHHHQQSNGKRPIAPAPIEHNRNSVISSIDHRGPATNKKSARMNFMPYGTQPASVQRRNARERNRVKQVNNGFANLRQHIPNEIITALTHGGRGASKKLSKVDTLRMAVEYIRQLQELLDDADTDASSSASTRSSQLSASEPYYTNTSIPPPPCSESSASPTPSYSSENSSISNNYLAPVPYYKNETYEYVDPEDEELLDCISWWQQQ